MLQSYKKSLQIIETYIGLYSESGFFYLEFVEILFLNSHLEPAGFKKQIPCFQLFLLCFDINGFGSGGSLARNRSAPVRG